MATLCISNTVWTNVLTGLSNNYRFFGGASAASSSPNALGTSAGINTVKLNIYQGSMPADFSAFSDVTQRSSDLLISFTLPNTVSYSDLGNANDVSRRFLMARHPANQAASASGVASWFLIASNFSTSLGDKAAIMGTVGLPGSGADLIIPNTNIVSGVNYQSSGLVLNFPYVFNV